MSDPGRAADPFDILRDHIDQQFANVHRRMDDRHNEFLRRFDGIDKRFDSVDDTLYGNGQPGLVTVVAGHTTRFQQLDTDTKAAGAASGARSGAAWGSAASAVMTAVFQAIAVVFFGKTPGGGGTP